MASAAGREDGRYVFGKCRRGRDRIARRLTGDEVESESLFEKCAHRADDTLLENGQGVGETGSKRNGRANDQALIDRVVRRVDGVVDFTALDLGGTTPTDGWVEVRAEADSQGDIRWMNGVLFGYGRHDF